MSRFTEKSDPGKPPIFEGIREKRKEFFSCKIENSEAKASFYQARNQLCKVFTEKQLSRLSKCCLQEKFFLQGLRILLFFFFEAESKNLRLSAAAILQHNIFPILLCYFANSLKSLKAVF